MTCEKVCYRGALLRGRVYRGKICDIDNLRQGGWSAVHLYTIRPSLLGITRQTHNVFEVLCSEDLVVTLTTAKLWLRAINFNKGDPVLSPHLSFSLVDQSGVLKPKHGGS